MAITRPIARLLLASVATRGPTASQILSRTEPADLNGLADGALLHGVPGYVRAAVRDHDGVPAAEVERLDELRQLAVRRHLRSIADLRLIAEVLDRRSIPWAVIKGPSLAEPLHGSPEFRWYNDLDILVAPDRFGDAVRELEGAGCRVPRHDWRHLERTLRAEIDVWMPSGTLLDLHWHLVVDGTRRSFTIDVNEVLERCRTLDLGYVRVPTLAWVDSAVYVALHTILSGGDRLIGLKDLQLALGRPEVSAAELWDRAAAWRAELLLRTAFKRVDASVGLPSTTRLEPARPSERAWDTVVRTTFRLSPAERQDGGASVGRLVSRAVRDTQAESLRALVGNGWIVVRHGSQGRRTWPTREEHLDGLPEPVAAQQRSAYFAAVALQ
jgi:hypothetical protein